MRLTVPAPEAKAPGTEFQSPPLSPAPVGATTKGLWLLQAACYTLLIAYSSSEPALQSLWRQLQNVSRTGEGAICKRRANQQTVTSMDYLIRQPASNPKGRNVIVFLLSVLHVVSMVTACLSSAATLSFSLSARELFCLPRGCLTKLDSVLG